MFGLISTITLLVSVAAPTAMGNCFFPAEFQGEFMTQASSRGGPNLQYAPITILQETIPIWGVCHRRFGNRVILVDRTGGTNCVRCFELTLRSLNVVQIHTEGFDKCFTTEEAAMATCPTDESIASGKSREIMLYKTKELSGDPVIAQEYCPVNGRYVFTYSVNDGLAGHVNECHEPVSELSNCPYGFGLGLRFKRCSFGDLEINFQCLGDWVGHNGQRYMALLDVQDSSSSSSTSLTTATTTTTGVLTSNGSDPRPRYRCALYHEDPETGKMYVALSSDSTCQNDLKSPKEGYETLVLTSIAPPPLPFEVSTSSCRFPQWADGQWQDVYIYHDTLIYKDLRNFKTYTLKCMYDGNSLSEEQGSYVVYGRTQCGEDFYTCVTMEKRGENVMEFQLSGEVAPSYNESLCHNSSSLTPNNWVTQGRIQVHKEDACPISGEYTGVIPDAEGLCAKLYSDCRNPQKMFYVVSNCLNHTEIYEEREYRCLGKFDEAGLTYTYTERRDEKYVLGYECFVGVIINEGELIIKEAGEHCQRDTETLRLGMKITRQATCYSPRPSSKPSVIPVVPPTGSISHANHPAVIDATGIYRPASPLPPHNSHLTTPKPGVKPWSTITGIPKGSSDADRTLVSGIIVALAIGLQFLLSIKFSHHC